MDNKFYLEGKIALVIGCKRSIEKVLVITLSEAGDDIIGISETLEKKVAK